MSETPRMKWFSVLASPFEIEGFPFYNEEKHFRRLMLNTVSPISPTVDELAWNTAGGKVRFRAKLQKLALRTRITVPHFFDHLTADAQCGFDCYADDGTGLKYYSTTRFDRSKTEYECTLFELDETRELEIVINFPLYSGVSELLLGFDEAVVLSPPTPRSYDKNIIVYGSSITQGGCATRPGMAYTNILSRRLDAQVINLGFSGSGLAEAEIAVEIAKIPNAGLFLLDCEANCHKPDWVAGHYPEFVRILRESYPTTPILLLTASPKNVEIFHRCEREYRAENKRIQRELVEERRRNGDANIYFLDYEDILGEEWQDETVDGTHATDLGFVYMANGLTPVIRNLLSLS
ncbi:MAG: hypothetical protein E7487_05935 [Ruminococcaceae bacterium]|nr:hypothetical protein [Oscillospiraceae bacterium]